MGHLNRTSGDGKHDYSNETVPIDNVTDGMFSRGTLLVRFPTTLLGKSWKRRYFTLHGELLYFHEDQSFIHPTLGVGSMSLNSDVTQGVNYEKCKRIDIANFWIIGDAKG